MKKVLSFLVLFVAIAMIATSVNAVSTDDLMAKVKELAAKYNVPETEYKASLTRYVENNENLTEAKIQEALNNMKATEEKLDSYGVTTYTQLTKLPASQKNEIISSASAAASAIDLKLSVTSKAGKEKVTVVAPSGESIVNVQVNPETGKIEKSLAYTGNDTNVVLVISSIVAVALVAGVITRKRFANA